MQHYCSGDCQKSNWGKHCGECIPRICGFISLFNTDPDFVNRDNAIARKAKTVKPVLVGEGGSILNILILDLVNAVSDRATDAEWEFSKELFNSVRVVVQNTKMTTFAMHQKAKRDSERAVIEWYNLKLSTSVDYKTALARWTKVREGATYSEDLYDRIISGLIGKEQALRRVLVACNKLLGLPLDKRREYETKRDQPQTEFLKNLLKDDFYAGLDQWKEYQRESIWLLYDYDETQLVTLNSADENEGEVPLKKIPANTQTAKMKREFANIPLVAAPSRVIVEGSLYGETIQKIVAARQKWMRVNLLDPLTSLRDDIVGLDSIKAAVGSFVNTLIFYPGENLATGGFLNFAIFGQPGTGKTEVSKRLPLILHGLGYSPVSGDFNRTTKQDWVSQFEGQTSHQTRMKTLSLLGQLIVFDESYNLVADARDSPGKEALGQIVNDMDEFRGLVMFCFLGYEKAIRTRLFATNEGLNARFSQQWRITPYTGKEIFQIFVKLLLANNYIMIINDSDVKDQFESLYQVGGFNDLNARAAPKILENYRFIYTSKTNNLELQDRLRRKDMAKVIELDTLMDAVTMFATQLGITMYKTKNQTKQSKLKEFHRFRPGVEDFEEDESSMGTSFATKQESMRK